MKPIYSTNPEKARKRRRISVRPIGVTPKGLKEEAKKYGITKISIGLTLINLGVNVVILHNRF